MSKGALLRSQALRALLIFSALLLLWWFDMFAGLDAPTELIDRIKVRAALPQSMRIACVGDSITFGNGSHIPGNVDASRANRGNYPMLLESELQRFVDLIAPSGTSYSVQVSNFGRGGATMCENTDLSYYGLPEFQSALESRADVYLILLGTNDSKDSVWPDCERRLVYDGRRLIRKIRKKWGPKPLVLLGLPIAVDDNHTVFGINGHTLRDDVVPKIASLDGFEGAKVIDVRGRWATEYMCTPMACLLRDGVHTNELGAEALMRVMKDFVLMHFVGNIWN